MNERLFADAAGADLNELADGEVRLVYIEEAAEETDDSDGGHKPLRSTAPPSLTRAVP